jgi:hypothetical protein
MAAGDASADDFRAGHKAEVEGTGGNDCLPLWRPLADGHGLERRESSGASL